MEIHSAWMSFNGRVSVGIQMETYWISECKSSETPLCPGVEINDWRRWKCGCRRSRWPTRRRRRRRSRDLLHISMIWSSVGQIDPNTKPKNSQFHLKGRKKPKKKKITAPWISDNPWESLRIPENPGESPRISQDRNSTPDCLPSSSGPGKRFLAFFSCCCCCWLFILPLNWAMINV